MDSSRLRVERETSSGSQVVIRLAGELDMSDADGVRTTLRQALLAAPRVVVDLAELSFIDSTGLLALHESNVWAKEQGARLVFVSPAPAVARVLELIGFDHLEFTDDRSVLNPSGEVEGTA